MTVEAKRNAGWQKSFFSTQHFWSGFLFGLGVISFLDEVVFHQLLHWHHFYDLAITEVGMVADGLFHAFSWFATVGSLFMFANLKRHKALVFKKWLGSALFGIGFFQLYDGMIQHKVLRIHQIRYGVDLFPYDLLWNLLADLLLIVGVFVIRDRQRKVR